VLLFVDLPATQLPGNDWGRQTTYSPAISFVPEGF